MLKPGTRVILRQSEERGIVLHTWIDPETLDNDCYVAFFGKQWPEEQQYIQPNKPYVLRYFESSLEVV